ncbi:PRD domain-containing protein [uncultured Lactobacillus sp.]|uniref:PRD domain-containing protein n=1 Tax=uncultured Lactobacillus sp. TaxID=153152 RepID=UPI0025DA490D|nr:PRD domain-containing protein [uncultured Lactobacillus sp.]
MLISQVLNNNVILVEDGGKQKIIWGRGIGFKAHAGENYKLKSQDKVFSAISDDDKWLASFKKLSEEVPRKYFELTEKIIQLAREEIDANFDEHLLIPLTDHIFFAVKRYDMGLELSNPMLFDIKRFFSQEYRVGKQAVSLIEQVSGVSLSDDEAGFIAIHLVEYKIQQSDSSIKNFSNFMEISNGVNNIIEAKFGRKFSENSIAVSRLMNHLHYLILRTNSKNNKSENENQNDSDLLKMLCQHNRKAASCLNEVVYYLQDKLNYNFSDSDRLYLLIHIIHVTS